MVSPRVNKVLEETKRLNVDERRQLLALLTEGEAPVTDGELDGLLVRKGILLAAPAKPSAQELARAEAWEPVAMQGKGLSETILEERR